MLWVKPEVTFIYEIIHSLHSNLEQYHGRYSTYVHPLTLSGAIELAMKHYKINWHSLPLLFRGNLLPENLDTNKAATIITHCRETKANFCCNVNF